MFKTALNIEFVFEIVALAICGVVLGGLRLPASGGSGLG